MSTNTRVGANHLTRLDLPERYEVIRHVANGGMASVWCADDLVLGRRVAIKLLAPQFADDDGAVRRFKREARAAARLSGHPQIVTIFDVGEAAATDEDPEAPARAFIVMEYLPGGTVAEAIRRGAIDRDQALSWVRQAAGALDYAHAQGVIHRDIKPGNMLLDRDRVLHVGDFGIARLGTEDTVTTMGQLMGTAAYLSPEQAIGRPATAASDRYALAVTAFELLAGTRPFNAEHFAAQARAHIEDDPPRASARNPALPPAVDAVLARGLAKDPEERWATAGEFADALERAAGKSAPPAIPVLTGQWGPRTATSRPRGPRVAALLALAAAALIAIAIAAFSGASKPTKLAHHHRQRSPASPATRVRHRPPVAASTPASGASAASTSSASTASPSTAPSSADTLEARGHQLMLGGDYTAAIPVLRQAAATAAPGEPHLRIRALRSRPLAGARG